MHCLVTGEAKADENMRSLAKTYATYMVVLWQGENVLKLPSSEIKLLFHSATVALHLDYAVANWP